MSNSSRSSLVCKFKIQVNLHSAPSLRGSPRTNSADCEMIFQRVCRHGTRSRTLADNLILSSARSALETLGYTPNVGKKQWAD